MAKKKRNVMRRGTKYVAHISVNGKQRWKSCTTEDEALLWLAQIRAQKIQGTFSEPSTILFGDFAADWLESHPGIDPRTRVLYAQRLRDYLEPVLGNLRLTEIRGTHIRQVLERAAKQGRSGWTMKGIAALCSGIMSYAVDQELIASNPVATLSKRDRPKSKEGGRGPKRILTKAELTALLLAAGPKYKPLFAVAVFGGLRLSEVLGLTWNDIDFDQDVIRVSKQLSVPNAFDPEPAHRVDLKSDSDEGCEREVFLNDDLARLLREHRVRGDRIQLVAEYVFQTSSGTPYSQRNISRAFDDAVTRAGIVWSSKADKPTFHSLRHTFASAIIAGGADRDHVARVLGHSDSAFTSKVYVHLFDRRAEADRSKQALGAAFQGVL